MQTYKICSKDLRNLSKTNDEFEDIGYQQQLTSSKIRKKDSERWADQHWHPPGFARDYMPSMTVSQMTKQNYRVPHPHHLYSGKENWDYRFYPVPPKWAADFRPLLENKSIGTASSNRTLKYKDEENSEGLVKHTSTITMMDGAKKQTRDAANLVAPCAKHIHRLALPPFLKPIRAKEASQFKEGEKFGTSGAKCAFITKGEHYTTGTQVSLVVVENSKIANNVNKTNENTKDNSKFKNASSVAKTGTASIASITSWDYFEDRLPDKKPTEKKRIAGIFVKQMSTPLINQGLYDHLDGLSSQFMVNKDVQSFLSNQKYPRQIYQVSPMKCFSNRGKSEHRTPPEQLIPTVRNSSGTLNYNEDDSQDTFMSNSIQSSPGESKKELSKFEQNYFKEKRSEHTSFADSIPAVFKDSVPKCSLHDEVNCRNAVCKKKSSYLFRRHHYYEAIMDQVQYIKKRINSLNFTLRDVEQLFTLIEKANEDLVNVRNDPKDKVLARKNKLKWEGFHKKVKSSKDETKFTLDTIKQLEQLFDTVLMNIEICENKFETPDDEHAPEDHLQLGLIELEENLREYEFLRNCKKGWIHEQLVQLDRLQIALSDIQHKLQHIILS